jgi:bacillithiol system protein YtxJ
MRARRGNLIADPAGEGADVAELVRITSLKELEAIFRESAARPVLLLKHSTRCGTSAAVFRDVHDFAARRDPASETYGFLELPRDRELADEVAARTGVRHESPQVLVLRDGRAAWHASHWRIAAPS